MIPVELPLLLLILCSSVLLLDPVVASTDLRILKSHPAISAGGTETVEIQRVDPPPTMNSSSDTLALVFSDVDGTLVHYPEDNDDAVQNVGLLGNRLLQLPPSSTGMMGVISSKTLRQCQEIRLQGVKLVLISGMRTSTLLKRLPCLPKADAYCCEAGGRIFYPITSNDNNSDPLVTPEPFDDALSTALEGFGLVEDLDWRREMSRIDTAGKDGFASNELVVDSQTNPIPIADREGSLWAFARQLLADGYALDTKGYATCFRVNRKQQAAGSEQRFDQLVDGIIPCPPTLSTSTNLGCVDFYPNVSGKRHCCEYLATKLSDDHSSKLVLSKQAVCMCDDDNDLEMALACLHAYVPSISSTSLAATIQSSPGKFTATCKDAVQGTHATEMALDLILERIAAGKT